MVTVSVVIPTRDRPDFIGQCLESIARCTHSEPIEVHVMDQSTGDETERIVRGLARAHAPRCLIRYWHLDEAGATRATNHGVRHTTTDIVAYTDDDVVVPSSWIRQIAEQFESDPQVGLLYGQVLVPEELQPLVSQGMIVPGLEWQARERLHPAARNFRLWGMGANMAFRRSAFDAVGGFDEMLGGGAPLRSSPDFDFALRVYRAGYAILLEPSIKVDHYGMRSPDQWPTTLWSYGFGDAAFYLKHLRCRDLTAGRLLARRLAGITRDAVRRSYREHRLPRLDPYARGMASGARESLRFGVNREQRLFIAPPEGVGTTASNPISAGHARRSR